MCYAGATLPKRVSFGVFADFLLTVATAALTILLITGCMTIRDAQITVKAESGSKQTVNIGNKTVTVPVNATVPLSAMGL